jgi:hypothetical protein
MSPEEASLLVNRGDGVLVPFSQKKAEEELERDHMSAVIAAREEEAMREMREDWSKWIRICIVSIVFVDLFIAINIGYHWMSFNGSQLPIFLADSILKVIVLAWIIVRFLFSKDSLFHKQS